MGSLRDRISSLKGVAPCQAAVPRHPHRVCASCSFGAPWLVRSGGGGCRVWFGSLPALSECPGDDCGGLTQAAPKQHLDATGMESTIFPFFPPIYRRRPYCVADFCHFPRFWKQSKSGKKPEETRKFKNLNFYGVVDFRHFPRFWKQSETGKKRETSKI